MDRYIGLDAHVSSCTLGVMTPSGDPAASAHLPGGRDAVGVAVRGAVARVKNRLKALYRPRGVQVAGRGVYTTTKGGEYLARLPKPAQPLLAELRYEQMDALDGLKREAKKAMLAEAKRHPEFRSTGVTTAGPYPVRVNSD